MNQKQFPSQPPHDQSGGERRSHTPPSFSRNITPASSSGNTASLLATPPALITWRHLKFLVMDAPSESNLPIYIEEMRRQNVNALVRVCEPTYSKAAVEAAGINLYEWIFPDGEGPPDSIIFEWLELVRKTFSPDEDNKGIGEDKPLPSSPGIGVHCVAGLGRYINDLIDF
jgi:protein tyrosine phosphatase type 4A